MVAHICSQASSEELLCKCGQMRWAAFLWSGVWWFGTLSSSLLGTEQFESQTSAFGHVEPSRVIYWLFVYPFFFYEGLLSGCL